jgi:predicted short-subunit dehydrogenase-like oxidoreductase (DUF2520 family)
MMRLNIVGGGRVGRVLGRLWRDAGLLEVAAVCNRSRASSARSVAFIGAGRALAELSLLEPADLVMVSVPDDAVAAVAEGLARAGPELRGSVVFHVSGVLGIEPLAATAERGARTASMHPLASFAEPERMIRTFAGTPCGLTGDDAARNVLRRLVTAIGGRAFDVDGEAKALYHAAAVVASNHLVATMALALRLFEAAGVGSGAARDIAGHLARQTLDNVVALGPENALTGPVARGDVDTVRRHLDALAGGARADISFYRAASRYLLSTVADLAPDADARTRLDVLLAAGERAGDD